MSALPRPFAMRRLPARYTGLVMPFVLSVMMTFVVSGVATLRSLGPTSDFLATWPAAWGLSWVVAFPTLLLVLPLVRRIVGLMVEPAPR
ncbi:DUF2798 domain-containing protein, partial [Methylorubrum zatmanii]